MVLYKFLILSFFILLLNPDVYSQQYPNAVVDSLMKKGINEIINQKYDDAKEDFSVLNKKFPLLPFGKIYLAATEIARSYDLAEEFNTDYIEGNLDEAGKQAKLLIEKDKNNVWNYYFKALADGYYAYFQALNKNWLPALNNGMSCISGFEKCLNLNPRFYDAYTAIGSFKYWKSRKTEFLHWLPFIDNEEQRGINYLVIATNHYSYNEYLAFNSLIWIYIDKKEYAKAVSLAQKVLTQYPGSRVFEWGLARAYEGIDVKKSIDIYYRILNYYQNIPGLNKYYEIVLKHIIAQQFYKLGESKKALLLCNEILALNNLSDYVKNKLGSRLNRVKELQLELSK